MWNVAALGRRILTTVLCKVAVFFHCAHSNGLAKSHEAELCRACRCMQPLDQVPGEKVLCFFFVYFSNVACDLLNCLCRSAERLGRLEHFLLLPSSFDWSKACENGTLEAIVSLVPYHWCVCIVLLFFFFLKPSEAENSPAISHRLRG